MDYECINPEIPVEEPPIDLQERLRAAITNSGLEPRVLWEIIESAASAGASGGVTAGIERVFQEWKRDFDDFADSMKAGQMETIRLSERTTRRAAEYETGVMAQISSSMYARLNQTTQQLLKQAEFQYQMNSQEPDYFHGPVILMAQAYEKELMVRLAWPIATDLVASGVRAYPGAPADGNKPQRQLISEGQVQKKNMALGSIAWYLRNHMDFGRRAQALGFKVDAIVTDAWAVIPARDKAAHFPVCERSAADELRRLILRPDGILSRLHPPQLTTHN